MVFVAYIPLSIYLVNYAYSVIKQDNSKMTKDVDDPKYEYFENNWNHIVIITTLGGVVSGMLGIGGGTLTTPLMIWMGTDPRVFFYLILVGNPNIQHAYTLHNING
jgi:uncharacterized membrane protein YfcA